EGHAGEDAADNTASHPPAQCGLFGHPNMCHVNLRTTPSRGEDDKYRNPSNGRIVMRVRPSTSRFAKISSQRKLGRQGPPLDRTAAGSRWWRSVDRRRSVLMYTTRKPFAGASAASR